MKKTMLLFTMMLFFFACKKDKDKPAPETAPKPGIALTKDLNDQVAKIDSISNFAVYLKDIQWSDDDAAAGITIFAPVNNAFANPAGRLAPSHMGALREKFPDSSDLEDYIIKGLIQTEGLTDGIALTTLSGKSLTVTIKDGQPYVNNILISGSNVASGDHYSLHTLAGLINRDILPAITQLSDAKTFPGWLFTIKGRNFDASPTENEVKFNGTAAVIHTATDTQLVVTVPVGATPGEITVKTPEGSATSTQDVSIMDAKVSTISSLLSLNCGNIQGVVVDKEDNLYFTDNLNYRVIGYSHTGQTTVYQPLVQQSIDLNQDGIIDENDKTAVLDGPWAIAVDPQGYLYVSSHTPGDGAIYKMATTAQALPELWAGGNGNDRPISGNRLSVGIVGITAMKFNASGDLIIKNGNPHIDGGDALEAIHPNGMVSILAQGFDFKSIDPTVRENPNFYGIAFDDKNNIYIADNANKRIWKKGSDGLKALAGNNNMVAKDGIGEAAQFGSPFGMTIDNKGNLYICDNDYATSTYLIRMINPMGVVTTIAGAKDNNQASIDGIGLNARFAGVNTIDIDSKGVFYIGSDDGHIRKLSIE